MLSRRAALAAGGALTLAGRLSAAPRTTPNVRTGLDRVLADPTPLKGKRIGLLTHDAALSADGRRGVDALAALPEVHITTLFAPEHGLAGTAAAGERIGDARDGRTGLPVYSLYGTRPAPEPAQLAGLDLLVIDLQDVGLRCYTYAGTALKAMEVAATVKLPVLLLDRPNPLGGLVFEGPALEEQWLGKTPVTALPTLYRHGLTLGEITRYLTLGGFGGNIALSTLDGWTRGMGTEVFGPGGLPFAPPSPNLRSPAAILAYAASVLVEGTNVSEGRGSDAPFELIGAPWIDGAALAKALARQKLPGVRFAPARFTPASSKHAGQSCGGVRLTVTDERRYRAFKTGVALVCALRTQAPERFAFLPGNPPFFDLLAGRGLVLQSIANGCAEPAVAEACERDRQRGIEWQTSGRIYTS
ncbi:MAG: exo-beta-N-acetylmuramidase NamZ domain-containing protein [Novosphingobium sp.]